MTSKVLDEAVGEDEVEFCPFEQRVGLERIAFHRSNPVGTIIGLIEVDDRDVARDDRSVIPPGGGAPEVDDAQILEVWNAAKEQLPSSST
jgi:hypothetical protein